MTQIASSPATTPAATGPTTGPSARIRVTLLVLSALTIMAGATISPALPAMQAHFAGVANANLLVKLALTIVGLAIAVSAPLSGVLADRFGRRPVLIWSLLLYAVGGASGLIVTSLGALLLGRVILGLAVAGTMTASGALINDLFSGQARGKFLSQQAAFNGFGGAVLLPLGGVLAAVGWRAPFALYLIALLLLPLVLRLPAGVPEIQVAAAADEKPNWRLIGLVYALALLYMLAFYLMPAQGPFLLRFLGVAPAATGLVLGGFTLVAALTSLSYSRLAGRFDARRVAALGFVLLSAGWVIVSQASTVGGVVPGLLVGGLGSGLVFPNLYAWLADITPAAWRGRVTAGMSSAVFLGQFLSPLVLTSPAAHPALGYTWGALMAGVVGALLLGYSFFGRREKADAGAIGQHADLGLDG
ncbi:MFS transporter [Deinococcus sp.]|uniref:MFS transporter n=1 Tax=Deinococcus sp. TaxID=47478 RepID=UPI003C7B86F2